jgi:hypothetical protein
MKKLFILTASILFFAIYVKAQTGDPELDYIKKTYSKDKKTIVGEYMNLNMQDSAKFWPLYGAYEASRQQIATVRINLIKLNLDYYGKIKNAIGSVNAAKYMQLEIYLQTMWKAIVQSNIPLIGQLNNTQQHN